MIRVICLLCFILLLSTISACQDSHKIDPNRDQIDSTFTLDNKTKDDASEIDSFQKGDEDTVFPLEKDLAILIPHYRAIYPILSIFPVQWLDAVDDALFLSDMKQRMSEENKPEDWSLVSLRISPCSPLGTIADPEEIDRICWPEIRLVLQPIVQLRNTSGHTILFPEDRAIHALYRVEPHHPILEQVVQLAQQNFRLAEIDHELLSEFEHLRDEVSMRMLEAVRKLRGTKDRYQNISERPEFFDAQLEEIFWDALTTHILEPYCHFESLHHLTAMSLPLGRAPVPLDLWSFVAFNASHGVLEQVAIEIVDQNSGEVFFSFKDIGKNSEDVTAARADATLLDHFSKFDPYIQDQLTEQSILDQTQIRNHAARIVDPYQTLVKHTTCSSCHRFNSNPFNFHNLSYFVNQQMTVSPRVEADVKRDLNWTQLLIERLKTP